MGVDRRRRRGQFVALPFPLLDSMAWRTLPHPGRTWLIALARRFRGNNNGNLAAPFRELREEGLFRSRDQYYRAMDAAWERGFTVLVRPGAWGVERRAHLWAITWWPVDANPKLDIRARDRTDDWKRWRPGTVAPDYERQAPLIHRQRAYVARQREKSSSVRKPDPMGPETGPVRLVK